MILNIYKPYGVTSFNIVAKVRGMLRSHYNKKNVKVGHAGTLDPLAEGVLVILTHSDTKKQDLIMKKPKEYIAEIALGAWSPTYDLEAPLTFTDKKMPIEELKSALDTIVPKYIGEIEQKVPAFSAAKVDGNRLYDLARQGELLDDDIPTKTVVIHEFEILSIKEQEVFSIDPSDLSTMSDHDSADEASMSNRNKPKNNSKFDNSKEIEKNLSTKMPVLKCRVVCGSGTYLRSLANDIGHDLGTEGVLISLVRSRVGEYSVDKSETLEQVEENISKLPKVDF